MRGKEARLCKVFEEIMPGTGVNQFKCVKRADLQSKDFFRLV